MSRAVAPAVALRLAGDCPDLATLEARIPGCVACPRLRAHCEEVAREKVKRFSGWEYWGRPVPGFGDPGAALLIVGLAPAAHGANRTGRMFTGDRSGDFLYAALHRAGLCNQPHSTSRQDGLRLSGVYISAAARCAPPANKPTPAEIDACRPFLLRELQLLRQVKVVLALGHIGHDAFLRVLQRGGLLSEGVARPHFRHGAVWPLPAPAPAALLDCYHVSQQNTFTGRLTPPMLDAILQRAKEISGLG